MEAENDMSITQELLAAMPTTQADAMTSQELFNVCKGAETANQIAKLLSALHGRGQAHRSQNAAGKNQYWLKKQPYNGPVISYKDVPSIASVLDGEISHNIPQFLRKTEDLDAADSVDENLGADANSCKEIKIKVIENPPKTQIKFGLNPIDDDLIISQTSTANNRIDDKLDMADLTPIDKKPHTEFVPNTIIKGLDNAFSATVDIKQMNDVELSSLIKTAIETPPFKVAITSQGTIMLFGLEYQPIELTPAQSKTLCNFITSADIEALLV